MPKAMTANLPRIVGMAVDAKRRGGPVRTTEPGVSWTALAAAAVLHTACLTAILSLVHSVPPPAASAVEPVVQMAFVPAAVAMPTKAEAPVVVTEPEAAAPATPATAFPAPEAAPSEPVASPAPEPAPAEPAAAVALDKPDEPPSPEPVAEPPVVAAQTVETPEEQPAEAPVTSVMATSPPVPPPPAAHQPRLPATHRVTPPQVASSRSSTPVHGPQQGSVSVVAAEAGAVRREAAQGVAHASDQETSLEARIRDAVQAAVRYPAAARMMDVTGRARVQLDYRDGAVHGPLLAQSSGTPMLDQAALSAAQDAHYPATPPALAGRLMRFLVWVEFRTG